MFRYHLGCEIHVLGKMMAPFNTRTDFNLVSQDTVAKEESTPTFLAFADVVVYYKDESECNAQMDAHAQRPRHQDNIQAHYQNHQTHRLRKSMGKESARGESRRDLSKAAAASKGAIG